MKRTLLGGDYTLVQPLTEGGMGEVWIAEQKSTGSRRAVKVMRPELVTDERARERFVQEARVSSLIKSDHVVQTLAAGIDDGVPWLAMELLEGETLAEWLARRPHATPEETSSVFLELCHALAAAHSAGIVHRDLKPENIFLATSRRPGTAFSVKVLDFGIAKLVAEAQTHTTAAIGTPLWMAPEQTTPSAKITPATDVWALGLIAFRMLVGASYWNTARTADANAIGLLREIAFELLESASTRAAPLGGPALPGGFDAWFARCVVRDPAARFRDARACHDALQIVLGKRLALQGLSPADLALAPTMPLVATLSSPAATRTPSRRWPLFAALGVAAVAITTWTWPRKHPPATSPATSATTASASATPSAVSSYAPIATPSGWLHKSCPDGMPRVPGGTFKLMEKQVTVAPFCLDEDEVTVYRYQQCVDKGACPPGQATVQSPVMDAVDIKKWSALCNYGNPQRLDHPINCVDFHAAKTFCASVKGRLPREAEWEWAARGGEEGRSYPWGELAPPAPNKQLLCWAKETGTLGTCTVATHKDGFGRFKQADLSGNVREWTDDVFDDELEKRVFRGGCFGVQEPAHAKVDVRAGMLPENRLHNVGFRCAASLVQ